MPSYYGSDIDNIFRHLTKIFDCEELTMKTVPLVEMNRKGFSEEPKAHDQIDTLIGQSYESDPDILGEHTTLLNYLAGAVSKPGSKDRYMHGIDGRELEKRMAEIESYSSKVDDSGTKRYTIPLLVPGSYPPKYEHESRSMQHWIEDYPLWINRSSINNP